ncbi:PEP-CTERM sorting domain-containing protein [Oscillatoria sp. CS-180]|nr:PEP-CTERM sorting domain-containing protein [Oscillatoria sp. CS-180]
MAASLATGTLLTLGGNAKALDFGFEFTTTLSEYNSPTGNVLLESVQIGDEVVSDFSYINAAEIIYNDPFLNGNTGAASADTGDDVTDGVRAEDATAADVVANLGTNNLNHIIDTEDNGTFVIDLQFSKTIDNLLIWERGRNSKLGVQAVDANGNLIGERRVIGKNMWSDAGYSIDTHEIGGAQAVGSLGINISEDLGIESGQAETIRFFSESSFNGPDWKFVGTNANRGIDAESVPEPALAVGITIFGSLLMFRKRPQLA